MEQPTTSEETVEPNNNDNSQGQTDGQPQGHPAWQELLDQLPDEFQPKVTEYLTKWNQGVDQKLQEVRSEAKRFDPYKDLIEQGIDPEYLNGAVHLAQQFQQNPDAVIEQATKAFNLPWTKAQQQAQEDEEVDLGEFGDVDISKHPVVQQMAQQLSELQQGFQTREQAEAAEQAQAEFEQQLEDLKEQHGEFNPLFVTALVQQGVDPEEAVNQYKSILQSEVDKLTNSNGQQQETPPVIMGGAGNVGSGLPDQSINVGAMKDGDVQDLVINLIKQQQENQS